MQARWALAVAVLVGAGLAAEVGYRLWFYGTGGLSPARLASVRPLGETDFAAEVESARIGYRLRRDVAGWFKLARFETSSAGLRDREYALAKPAGSTRIAVVGDSFTMGSGVALEETFHGVLEARLGEEGVELINFGVGGYGLLNELALIEQVVFEYGPDLIVLGLTWNDVEPPEAGYLRRLFPEAGLEQPAPAQPALTSFWRPTLLDRLRRSPRVEPGQVELREALALRAVTQTEPEVAGAGDWVAAAFARLAALSEARAVPVLCVYLSTGAGAAHAGALERLRSAAEGAGLAFLDTSEQLAGIERAELIVMPNDGHPNARAHRAYADALEAELRGRGWLSP